MTFTEFLKSLLIGFVTCYQKNFKRTFSIAILLTVVCIGIWGLLYRYSEFDRLSSKERSELINYFFYRFSKGATYSLIDLSKIVFIFFVSLFSLGLTRSAPDRPAEGKFSFSGFLSKIKIKDLGYLLGTLVITLIIDFLLFEFTELRGRNKHHSALEVYLRDIGFHLRLYVPMILFAMVLSFITSGQQKITLKKVFLLYVSLWLFNEFAFEVFSWAASNVLPLVLMPVQHSDRHSLYAIILGIPLFAFFMLGYHRAMTLPLELTESDH